MRNRETILPAHPLPNLVEPRYKLYFGLLIFEYHTFLLSILLSSVATSRLLVMQKSARQLSIVCKDAWQAMLPAEHYGIAPGFKTELCNFFRLLSSVTKNYKRLAR